jgi:hypothetical protein
MGVPGPEKMGRVVKLLKNNGYGWLILPIEAVKADKTLPYERQMEIFSRPHVLRTEGREMTVIFRPRYDFLDQQGGVDANGVYNKSVEAARILERAGGNHPALVVPASDGENGNVMMNHFFPDTFIPFFREKLDDKVSSMTVTSYLEEYPPEDEIELQASGGSWLGGHSQWEKGNRRTGMKVKVEQLSRRFHELHANASENEEALRAVLLAETSCYVYWNSDFWFDQGDRMIEYAYQRIEHVS